MWDASGNISEHSVSVVHCFTLSHTHTLTESHTGPPCMSHCTAYLTRNTVYKTRSSFCSLISLFDRFNPEFYTPFKE
jgi:hypothetical protein